MRGKVVTMNFPYTLPEYFIGEVDRTERLVSLLQFCALRYESAKSQDDLIEVLEKGLLYRGMVDMTSLGSFLFQMKTVFDKFSEFTERLDLVNVQVDIHRGTSAVDSLLAGENMITSIQSIVEEFAQVMLIFLDFSTSTGPKRSKHAVDMAVVALETGTTQCQLLCINRNGDVNLYSGIELDKIFSTVVGDNASTDLSDDDLIIHMAFLLPNEELTDEAAGAITIRLSDLRRMEKIETIKSLRNVVEDIKAAVIVEENRMIHDENKQPVRTDGISNARSQPAATATATTTATANANPTVTAAFAADSIATAILPSINTTKNAVGQLTSSSGGTTTTLSEVTKTHDGHEVVTTAPLEQLRASLVNEVMATSIDSNNTEGEGAFGLRAYEVLRDHVLSRQNWDVGTSQSVSISDTNVRASLSECVVDDDRTNTDEQEQGVAATATEPYSEVHQLLADWKAQMQALRQDALETIEGVTPSITATLEDDNDETNGNKQQLIVAQQQEQLRKDQELELQAQAKAEALEKAEREEKIQQELEKKMQREREEAEQERQRLEAQQAQLRAMEAQQQALLEEQQKQQEEAEAEAARVLELEQQKRAQEEVERQQAQLELKRREEEERQHRQQAEEEALRQQQQSEEMARLEAARLEAARLEAEQQQQQEEADLRRVQEEREQEEEAARERLRLDTEQMQLNELRETERLAREQQKRMEVEAAQQKTLENAQATLEQAKKERIALEKAEREREERERAERERLAHLEEERVQTEAAAMAAEKERLQEVVAEQERIRKEADELAAATKAREEADELAARAEAAAIVAEEERLQEVAAEQERIMKEADELAAAKKAQDEAVAMEKQRLQKEAAEKERIRKEADELALAARAQEEADKLAAEKKIQEEAAALAAERLRQAQEDAIAELVAAEVEAARLAEERHERLRQETIAEYARRDEERLALDAMAMDQVEVLTAQLERAENAQIERTQIEEEIADQASIDRKLALIRLDNDRTSRRDAIEKLRLPEIMPLTSPVSSVSPALHHTRSIPPETGTTIPDESGMMNHLDESAVVNHEESYDASRYYESSTMALDDTKMTMPLLR